MGAMATWVRVIELVRLAWFQVQQGRLPPLGPWAYPVLSLLTAIEGPCATLLAAASSATGLTRPGWVFVSAATGNLVGDALWYTLGRAGRMEWIVRLGGRFGLKERQVDHLRSRVLWHAPRVVFVAKLTAALMIPVLLVAGLTRARWRRWFPPLVAAEIIWTGSLVFVGYHAAEAVRRVESAMQGLGLAAVAVLVILGLWWLRRAWLARETGDAPEVTRADME